MAFFLFTGLALGATAVALSEADRDRYRYNRVSMSFIGSRGNGDIYYDRTTGFYYHDDGWDVRRVGKTGWRPHPVDLERLKGQLAKFSPGQVKFAGYILTTYMGKEQQLWNTLFKRYRLPKEPKKPHFGRKLRSKERYDRYDEEYEMWQKECAAAKQEFRDECAAWNLKKRDYNASHEHASSGTNLLHQAMGGVSKQNEVFKLVVPAGKKPGDIITVEANGKTFPVMIPSGSAPGTEIQFEIPKAQASTASNAANDVPTAQAYYPDNDVKTESIPTAATATSSSSSSSSTSSTAATAGDSSAAGSSVPPAAMNPFDSASSGTWGAGWANPNPTTSDTTAPPPAYVPAPVPAPAPAPVPAPTSGAPKTRPPPPSAIRPPAPTATATATATAASTTTSAPPEAINPASSFRL